jgi:large subunit ribosomal protein L15
MRLSDVRPPVGATHKRKRVGRGMGSGHGKTSTRGMKGQKARDTVRPGFEGGQTPLYRRLRKRRGMGKSARNLGVLGRSSYAEVNVGRLEVCFDAGAEVTPQALLERRVIRDLRDGLRVLGDGELQKALTVHAHHFSGAARAKIEAAGGSAVVIGRQAAGGPAEVS